MRLQVSMTSKNEKDAYVEFRDDTLPEANNLSNTSDVTKNTDALGSNGFQLSDLDAVTHALDGSKFPFSPEGYSGFISKSRTDREGILLVEFYFYVVAYGPTVLRVLFDRSANEYAKTFYITDASTNQILYIDMKNTKVSVDIPLNISQPTKLKLFISVWSKPFASVKICRIATDVGFIFTGKDLYSCDWSVNSFDTQMQISPGSVSQYADIEVYDRADALRKKLLATSSDTVYYVSIVAVDDDANKQHFQGDYCVTDFDFDDSKNTVRLLCSDLTENFDKIMVSPTDTKDRTVHEWLEFLFTRAGSTPWKYENAQVKTDCEKTVTPNSWFKECSLQQLLNKICTVGMLRVYWHTNTFVVARCW